MDIYSWNVNGFRSCIKKGFLDFFNSTNADIFCIQETKIKQIPSFANFPGYYSYWNFSSKNSHSGTAIFSKFPAKKITYDLDNINIDVEGRIITLEFESFILVNVYTPNSQQDLSRMFYRMDWDIAFQTYIKKLNNRKPVIICGDFNVSHTSLDATDYFTSSDCQGFSSDEQGQFSNLLSLGFVDAFRFLYPNTTHAFTWWTHSPNARTENIGWRLDYFLVPNYFETRIVDSKIHNSVFCSDHCPISLKIDFRGVI